MEHFYNEGVSHSEPADRMSVFHRFPGCQNYLRPSDPLRSSSIQGMLGIHPARGALAVAGLRQIAAVLGDGEQGSQGRGDFGFGEFWRSLTTSFDAF